jgi:hypothetical protein
MLNNLARSARRFVETLSPRRQVEPRFAALSVGAAIGA